MMLFFPRECHSWTRHHGVGENEAESPPGQAACDEGPDARYDRGPDEHDWQRQKSACDVEEDNRFEIETPDIESYRCRLQTAENQAKSQRSRDKWKRTIGENAVGWKPTVNRRDAHEYAENDQDCPECGPTPELEYPSRAKKVVIFASWILNYGGSNTEIANQCET